MKEIKLDELKTIQVDILQAVHDFCHSHGLKYSLCGGSLIGAIRHNGFIPWDDDIDILMPRKDYLFLCQHFNDEGSRYIIHSLYNDSAYDRPFAKVEDSNTLLKEYANTQCDMGIAIDVFPYDNIGDTIEDALKIEKKVVFWHQLLKGKLVKVTSKNSFVKKICIYGTKIAAFWFSKRWLSEKIDRLSQLKINDTEYVGDLVWGYGKKELFHRSTIENVFLVPFEGRMFYAFVNYDIYLKQVYGDYMELPPENNRQSPHTLNGAFWKNKI